MSILWQISHTGVHLKTTELESMMRDGESVIRPSHISRKVRRKRTVFSRTHLDLLLKTFETNPYPGISVREQLSQLTGVHESRIQVWFQNRRARKNKKFPQEPKNLSQENAWQQFSPIAHEVNQSKNQFYSRGPQHTSIYKLSALPVHPLSHLHMNSSAESQRLKYSFPCQITNPISSGELRPTDSAGQQHHPCMSVVCSSPLSDARVTIESNHAEYTSCMVKTPEPDPAPQESSLQDVLAEFQPCWSEVANNIKDGTDCLLCLF